MVFYVVNNGFDIGNFLSMSCLNHKAYHVKNVGFGPRKIIPDSVDPKSFLSDRIKNFFLSATEWRMQCCGTVIILYGSCSGSDFWKVMVPVPTFDKFRFRLHI
jgi:hypothetical protein